MANTNYAIWGQFFFETQTPWKNFRVDTGKKSENVQKYHFPPSPVLRNWRKPNFGCLAIFHTSLICEGVWKIFRLERSLVGEAILIKNLQKKFHKSSPFAKWFWRSFLRTFHEFDNGVFYITLFTDRRQRARPQMPRSHCSQYIQVV